MLRQCGIYLTTSRRTGLVLFGHRFQPKCLFHKYQSNWLIVDVDPVLGTYSWMITSPFTSRDPPPGVPHLYRHPV